MTPAAKRNRGGRRRANGEGTYYSVQTPAGIRWEAKFYDEHGRRVKRRYSTEREARAALKAAITRRESGLSAMPARHTMGQLFDAWLASLGEQVNRGERSPQTYAAYESDVRQHMRPALGHIDCRRLTVKDCDDYLGSLRLAPKSRANQRIGLRRALNVGKKWGWVDRNVAEDSDPIATPQREVAALSLEDAQILLYALKDEPLYSAFVTALYTGLRAGELAGLLIADVDLEAATLHVHQQVLRVKGRGLIVSKLKTQASTATIDLIPEALAVLSEAICDRSDGYVWESAPGRPYWPTSFTHALARALRRAGLPHVRLHDLRHYFISFLPQLDVHPAIAQRLARHASIGTTMNRYTSVEDAAKRQAMGRLHDALSGAAGPSTGTRSLGIVRRNG
jgi:integrase